MKIKTAQYSKALYELTVGKTEREVDVVVSGLVKVLGKNRQTKLLSKIIEKFSEIYNQENGIVEAEVTSARNNDQETRNRIGKFIKDKYQAKEIILKEKVDLDIKGGIVIKVGDEILDGSVVRQLQELKNNLIK